MKYLYIDGDDIGLKIETCFMENDENGLSEINASVIEFIDKIKQYLLSNNIEIIFNGADGVIGKSEFINSKDTLDFSRCLKKQYTFSLGVSDTLRGAYVALRYAKSKGKNIAIEYINNSFKIIK